MKALVATLSLLLSAQFALADCTEINRQAMPKKAALQAATDEYKKSVVVGLRETVKESPPIDVIAHGIAASSKMITAMDQLIDYLRLAQNAGCFGKDANAWAAAIAKMEAQRDEMRRDRAVQADMLAVMARAEEKRRK